MCASLYVYVNKLYVYILCLVACGFVRLPYVDVHHPHHPANSYAAGDHVALYPTNNVQLVTRLGDRLRVDLDQVVTLDAIDGACVCVCVGASEVVSDCVCVTYEGVSK